MIQAVLKGHFRTPEGSNILFKLFWRAVFWTQKFWYGFKESALTFDMGDSDGFFLTTNFRHGVKELALGIDLGFSERSFFDPKISKLGQRMGSNLWLRPFCRVILGPKRALRFYSGCSDESFFGHKNFDTGSKNRLYNFILAILTKIFWQQIFDMGSKNRP